LAAIRLLYYLLSVLMVWILIDALAGWFMPDPSTLPRSITMIVTEPLYKPLRALVGTVYTGQIDFSPLIVLLAISAMRRPLWHKMQFGGVKTDD
jgi:uncharacterized protein YggT (Ycf19 family)